MRVKKLLTFWIWFLFASQNQTSQKFWGWNKFSFCVLTGPWMPPTCFSFVKRKQSHCKSAFDKRNLVSNGLDCIALYFYLTSWLPLYTDVRKSPFNMFSDYALQIWIDADNIIYPCCAGLLSLLYYVKS